MKKFLILQTLFFAMVAISFGQVKNKNTKAKKTTKSTKSTATKGAVKSAATEEDEDGNCGCDYFPLCDVNGTKSFQGKIYKYVEFDNGKEYYNCDGGVLTVKREVFLVDYYGNSTPNGYETEIYFDINKPVGYKWLYGAQNEYSRQIIAKDTTITFKGIEWGHVMIILEKTGDNMENGKYGLIKASKSYYAETWGFLGSEDVTEEEKQVEANAEMRKHPLTKFKWAKEPQLVTYGPSNGQYSEEYYLFNPDGTFELWQNFHLNNYSQPVIANKFNKVKEGFWKQDKQVDRFILFKETLQINSEGVLEKVETSDWHNGILVVKKSDGSIEKLLGGYFPKPLSK